MPTILNAYSDLDTLKQYSKDNNISLADIRHAQVCYLYEVKKLSFDEIRKITGYALSTLNTIKRKIASLIDFAVNLFEKGVQKINDFIEQNSAFKITWEKEHPKDGEYCAYVITIENKFHKIGYSKEVRTRMRQLKNQYRANIIVHRVFTFENEKYARGMEDSLRGMYCARNDKADYIYKDRFLEQRYSPADDAEIELLAKFNKMKVFA